ncbi:F0F1 ATP synthase subunit delta [Phragmitibacter flavus]|uniref:F0F1 ATP synthase subunit delta n=1 Tax=Phragmitibacter flavus TaxID=2576071 RepID=A0A5R8KFQ6_9BACT|nr:F0F1 ATP synthase subunit delta [Phragmitibacter flavus]TLD70429.1 F0F1 ATP synthase subunit delta [Phragmitibacter flavus]
MKISKDALRAARQLFRACSDANGKMHGSRIKRVVKLVGEKKPRNYQAILTAFLRLVRLEVEKRSARVESAVELTTPVRDQLRADLQRKFGDDLSIEFYLNPALLGGMRVRVGSQVWDGSVRAKLDALREKVA